MLKLLPRLVTSFPQVAASLYPSGRTQSTMGDETESERFDLWTSLETTASSFSLLREGDVRLEPPVGVELPVPDLDRPARRPRTRCPLSRGPVMSGSMVE